MSHSFLPEIRNRVQTVLPDIISLRHDLHANPELSGSEERTARTIADLLTKYGIPHVTGVGDTHGVVATIQGGAGEGPVFALRGDMDALPIVEENDVEYRSTVPGVMHACGHDGHTANLMGAAIVLNEMRANLKGTVKLIFQPAEETVRGADALVAAGVVDDVEAIVMLHGWPDLPIGKIGVRNGPAMASADGFDLTIHGKGGHGAYPHNTIDPIAIGAQVITALQTIVAREVSPVSPAVVSVTQFHAGTAYNVIPGDAKLVGTVRTLDPVLRTTMPERIERVIKGVCDALRATYTFDYHFGTPVTVNTPAISDLIREVGRDVIGAENVFELPEPTMGAEDFAYYLEKVPGAMFRLGVGCPYLLHTPKYDFGDTPLETGMVMMVELAHRYLNRSAA
jgi:amidohydrolase